MRLWRAGGQLVCKVPRIGSALARNLLQGSTPGAYGPASATPCCPPQAGSVQGQGGNHRGGRGACAAGHTAGQASQPSGRSASVPGSGTCSAWLAQRSAGAAPGWAAQTSTCRGCLPACGRHLEVSNRTFAACAPPPPLLLLSTGRRRSGSDEAVDSAGARGSARGGGGGHAIAGQSLRLVCHGAVAGSHWRRLAVSTVPPTGSPCRHMCAFRSWQPQLHFSCAESMQSSPASSATATAPCCDFTTLLVLFLVAAIFISPASTHWQVAHPQHPRDLKICAWFKIGGVVTWQEPGHSAGQLCG